MRPDLRTALPMAAVAYVGAVVGALIGLHIPKAAFNPIILVMLIAVGAYTLLRPSLGEATVLRYSGHRHTVVAMLIGLRHRRLRRGARPGHRLVPRARPWSG